MQPGLAASCSARRRSPAWPASARTASNPARRRSPRSGLPWLPLPAGQHVVGLFHRGGRTPGGRGVEPLTEHRCDREDLGASVRTLAPTATGPSRARNQGSPRASRRAGPPPGRTRRGSTGAWPSPAGKRGCPRFPARVPRQRELAFPEHPAGRGLQQRGDGTAVEPAEREAPADRCRGPGTAGQPRARSAPARHRDTWPP